MKKLVVFAAVGAVVAVTLYWGLRDKQGRSHSELASEWDNAKALSAAMRVLQGTDWKSKEGFCSSKTCKPVHEFYGDFAATEGDKHKRVLATTSIEEGSDCHACAPHLSFFEFVEGPKDWELVRSDVDVFQWGQWGKLEQGQLKIVSIGKGVYGVRADGGSTGQGVTEGHTSIFALIDNKYREVFSEQTAEDDDNNPDETTRTSWDSVVRLQPGDGEFMDVLVERKGVRDGKPFNERELFRFNRESYESVSTEPLATKDPP